MIAHIATTIGIGVGATLFIDAWNAIVKRVFAVPSLNYCLLGRWVGYLPRGVFRHRAIGATPARSFECTLGWIAHYAIGVMLAVAFVYGLAPGWSSHPTLPLALVYGIATVIFPFFVLQPALGFGIASAATPRPARARLKSLATHGAYGVGLYVCGYIAASLVAR